MPPDGAAPVYVFVHVSKVGGTTVADVLARRFGKRLQHASTRPGNRTWPRVADPLCYSGHEVTKELERIRSHADVRWFSWVRDPFRTAVSFYFYARDVLTPQHPPGTFFVDRGLRTWLCHSERRSWPLMPGYDHGRMHRSLQNLGLELDDFAFLGVTERFAESMLLMFNAFGWEPMPFHSRNPRRSRLTDEEREVIADPNVRAEFESRNAKDLALYDHAVRRLDTLREQFEPSFTDELREYQDLVERHERRWRLWSENPVTNALRRVWRISYNARMRRRVRRTQT